MTRVTELEAPEEQKRAVFTTFCSDTDSTPFSFTRTPQYVTADLSQLLLFSSVLVGRKKGGKISFYRLRSTHKKNALFI